MIPPVTKEDYRELCLRRWHGQYLRDALRNFSDFQCQHDLIPALISFKNNPSQQHLDGTYLNPDGTLTSFLWKLQDAVQLDKSCLQPFLDFNEDSQTIFIRRGLIYYCQLVLNQIELPTEEDPRQTFLQFNDSPKGTP